MNANIANNTDVDVTILSPESNIHECKQKITVAEYVFVNRWSI